MSETTWLEIDYDSTYSGEEHKGTTFVRLDDVVSMTFEDGKAKFLMSNGFTIRSSTATLNSVRKLLNGGACGAA